MATKINNQKRLVFMDKRITLDHNPRIGVCFNCKRTTANGEIDKTVIHHIEYDINNPLAHTIELCISCHRVIHPKRHEYKSTRYRHCIKCHNKMCRSRNQVCINCRSQNL